jgi:hypothetical protein
MGVVESRGSEQRGSSERRLVVKRPLGEEELHS